MTWFHICCILWSKANLVWLWFKRRANRLHFLESDIFKRETISTGKMCSVSSLPTLISLFDLHQVHVDQQALFKLLHWELWAEGGYQCMEVWFALGVLTSLSLSGSVCYRHVIMSWMFMERQGQWLPGHRHVWAKHATECLTLEFYLFIFLIKIQILPLACFMFQLCSVIGPRRNRTNTFTP